MDDRTLVARLDGRRFVATDNPEGVADAHTIFHYRSDGAAIAGTYRGGTIQEGYLLGRATSDDSIELLYHCRTTDGELRCGRSSGRLSLDSEGRMRLEFEWEWLTGDRRGGRSRYREIVTRGV